jgi:RNA polymerase sigma-70 factor, ECF subfamily
MLNNFQYGADNEMQNEIGQLSCEATSVYHASEDSIESNEETLLADAQAGNIAAFEQLIKHYEPTVFRLARRIGHSREDAEEITQNAFVQAFKNLSRFRGDSRFATWLGRIAINEGLMKLRKLRGRRLESVSLDDPVEIDEHAFPREIEDQAPNPEQLCSRAELQGILAKTIARLSPAYRMAFQLHYVDDFSIEETADLLHVSATAVKSRLSRARMQLRLWLSRYLTPLSSAGLLARGGREGQ